MPARVQIDAGMLSDAKSMAHQTYIRFSGQPGYYDNTPNHHLVGKIGELACAQWAASLGVDCDQAFRDVNRMDEADLILNLEDPRKLRIEVKAWSSHLWEPFGRCVPARQMPQVSAKADIVMWCVVTPLDGVFLGHICSVEVDIAGWNKMTDIGQIQPTWTGPTGKRQVCNHQVPMDQVRPLDDLVAKVKPQA